MKSTILTITLLLTAMSAFSQQEKKTSIELNDRTKFVEVTPRRQLLNDTIYHMNSGFRINPEFDVERIGDEDYVIFTYPNFNYNGKQAVRDISTLQNLTADSLVVNAVHKELIERVNDTLTIAINGKTFAMKKTEFDLVKQTTYYSVSFKKWKNYNFSSGLMTVPFKLRPKLNDSTEFNLTTDITLGGYFGLTKRISSSKRNYITIPATLGISYININDNNTTNVKKDNSIGVVPGITWSTGIIFQIEDFNIGFVLGQDYASSVGNKWIYNGKTWYSFAIGYNFLTQK
jgi:uncharacterized protein YlzI (FlbEa/FlbD family)